MQIRFRPIQNWPKEKTASRKGPTFKATYDSTLNLLVHELEKLGASEVVIEVAMTEDDFRIDGWPKSGAHASWPGVAVYAETRHGPLTFATDVFEDGWNGMPGWKANLRAIALGLEALRQVDRYGITSHGEQYTGWKALGTGIALGPATMDVETAGKVIADGAGLPVSAGQRMIDDPEARKSAFRVAAKQLHPDTSEQDAASFRLLNQAKKILDERDG